MNLPGVVVDLPTLTDKDVEDLQGFALKNNVDFIAASFVRKGSDVDHIRKVLGEQGSAIQIISKIENQEGIQNFEDILEKSDGIMVCPCSDLICKVCCSVNVVWTWTTSGRFSGGRGSAIQIENQEGIQNFEILEKSDSIRARPAFAYTMVLQCWWCLNAATLLFGLLGEFRWSSGGTWRSGHGDPHRENLLGTEDDDSAVQSGREARDHSHTDVGVNGKEPTAYTSGGDRRCECCAGRH
jgi:hypothetical protein